MPDTEPGQSQFSTKTAQILLDIKAVNFRPEEPYKFTSGWASPVYIDCRKIISYTQERRAIIEMAVNMLDRTMDLKALDAVAGGETAGIPYAAWISEAVSLPMLYVRKQPKGFGRNAQIEGDLAEGSRVLLVEDLATDGASKLNFVNALRKAGATVNDAFVVFFYDIFKGALDSLEAEGITMHYLATWRDVLRVAAEQKRFPDSAIAEVRKFLDDPISWSAAHGGKGET
ncbi:MAG: orotate phosphoribosyltransferase [Rhodospirillales bacterium]